MQFFYECDGFIVSHGLTQNHGLAQSHGLAQVFADDPLYSRGIYSQVESKIPKSRPAIGISSRDGPFQVLRQPHDCTCLDGKPNLASAADVFQKAESVPA
jgi:hypothetical protein